MTLFDCTLDVLFCDCPPSMYTHLYSTFKTGGEREAPNKKKRNKKRLERASYQCKKYEQVKSGD